MTDAARRLTGDPQTDAETALEDLRVVRGWLLDVYGVHGGEARDMWRRLNTASAVLKTMATKTEAA